MHSRKHFCAEVVERCHLLLFRAHAYVAFVNQGIRAPARFFVLPFIGFRIPYLSAEHFGVWVLNHPGGIGRDALSTSPGPFDEQFVKITVMQE